MIVDCHVNTWRWDEHCNGEVIRLNELPRRRSWPDERLKKAWDNPIESYLSEMGDVVDKGIILPLQYGKTFGVHVPNDYVAELVKKYPDKLAAFCSVVPTEEGAVEELERGVTQLGLIGLKMSPTYQCFYPHDEKYFPLYQKAQDLGVPVAFHTGFSQPRRARLIYGNLVFIDELAHNFPDLKIIIGHMGYYHYEDTISLVMKHDNVFADISWLPSLAGLDRHALRRELPVIQYPYLHFLYPLLYYFTQTFGMPNKLLFGSDWPTTSPKDYVELLEKRLNLMLTEMHLPEIPEQNIHDILHENWKQVFDFDKK